MSKAIATLVFILSLGFLVSCSETSDKKTINIGFSQGLGDHPWRDEMNHAMEVQASLHSEINLKIYKAEDDLNQQISDIETMINEKLDVIIISPIESDTVVPIIEKAFNLGIPIVLLDRKINSDMFTTYIGADNIEVGREAGKYMLTSSKDLINIIEIKGDDSSSPTKERSIGFHEIVDKQESFNLIKTFKGFQANEFKHTLDSLGDKNIDFIFAFNDDLASQAWETARKAGVESNIKFIGVDGLNFENGGIQMVLDGKFSATILYPTGGAEAIESALRISKGESVSKRQVLSTTIIDRFNADIMKNQFDKIDEQQAIIESQVGAVKKREELYYSQNSMLKLSITILIMILILTIYTVYSILIIRKKNRQLTLTNEKITIQRNQIEKIANEVKESNEAKLNFFTGLSHEFKTPLTLILGAIESLKESYIIKGSTPPYEIELVNKNSNRLLRLINNLLDFRKIENKMFNMGASKTNVYNFTYGVYRDFENESKRRGIDFKIQTNNKDLELYFDRNLMDKVYFNLLSNAFKFTPDNGEITISIVEDPKRNEVAIHFKDNGIGIPADEIKDVFEPFFKGSNNRKNSSGIGLHLSKQFIELHLGKIEVKSVQGTEFIITLAKGSGHFDGNQLISQTEVIDAFDWDAISEIIPMERNLLHSSSNADDDRYTILLIEDNEDLLFFLKNKFSTDFQIILSKGEDAEEKAFDVIPDIVICDVNLPGTSGFELCEILKNDLRTSHIPIIILTAMSNKESYLQGLKAGADLYLTKPFSYSILMQSIQSLLYNREKLRYYYTNNISKLVSNKSFGNVEQEFIVKLNSYITENLDNSDFSVENLAVDLHMSRVQLYRKVKAIVGVSVSDYINNFKLEIAKGMLDNTQLNISQIAYKNGFSSPNYFSTVFKNKYGISPNAYRNASK